MSDVGGKCGIGQKRKGSAGIGRWVEPEAKAVGREGENLISR